MKRKLTAGQTSISLPIFVQDTSSTTGGGLSGLTSGTSGLVAEYRRRGASAWTAITLTSKTLGTWTSGGFVADGALSGAYELDVPDAAVASGARWVAVRLRGAANMLPCLIEIELDSFDYQTATQPVNVTQFGGTNGTFTSGKPTTELDSSSVTAVQSGLATAAAVQSVKDDTGTTLPAQSTAIYNRLGVPAGASMSADVAAVKADTASLLTRLTANAATAIQNLFHMITGSGSGSKFTTAALENGSAAGGASLEDIIAGVQSVSGGIIAAQDESALYITIGDTWTQDIESLGNLTNKTVSFAIKSKAKDADTSAVVMIVEGTGLTRLNGAATTAGWGSIEILDETAGDIRLRLESDATSLLTSGTYVDAVKALEDGDDRTLRQKGRTVVSAGVIADIT